MVEWESTEDGSPSSWPISKQHIPGFRSFKGKPAWTLPSFALCVQTEKWWNLGWNLRNKRKRSIKPGPNYCTNCMQLKLHWWDLNVILIITKGGREHKVFLLEVKDAWEESCQAAGELGLAFEKAERVENAIYQRKPQNPDQKFLLNKKPLLHMGVIKASGRL